MKKKWYKRIYWERVVRFLIIISLVFWFLIGLFYYVLFIPLEKDNFSNKETIVIKENISKANIIEETNFSSERIISIVAENYRLTSYYTGDNTGSTLYTGSGMMSSQFQINEKGWYTYNGRLVLAGATNECLNAKTGACGIYNEKKDGKKYFNYFDIVQIIIDGIIYEGIILDSCGESMRNDANVIDIFVSSKNSVIDRGYQGVNPVMLIWEEK